MRMIKGTATSIDGDDQCHGCHMVYFALAVCLASDGLGGSNILSSNDEFQDFVSTFMVVFGPHLLHFFIFYRDLYCSEMMF